MFSIVIGYTEEPLLVLSCDTNMGAGIRKREDTGTQKVIGQSIHILDSDFDPFEVYVYFYHHGRGLAINEL